METLLLILVFFAVHLAVLFSIALVFSGLTSLVAVAGFGGRTALAKRGDTESPGRLPRLLGFVGVAGAILTAVTLGVPLFFGENFVQPYLDGLHQRGGPQVTLGDASMNIAGGKMRSDSMQLRQTDGAYLYEIDVETLEARLSPIAALGSNPQIQQLSVTGVDGWLAPGYGEEAVAANADEPPAFSVDELLLEDIRIEWRPEVSQDAVGSLTIDTWRTENIDHEYTLLDLLGRTRATGTFLEGALEFTHTAEGTGHTSGWTLDEMSLAKAGAAVGGPMKFVREGTFSLRGGADWDETLASPAKFSFEAKLGAVNFGPPDDDASAGSKLMGALTHAVARSIPEGARTLEFSIDFEISPDTLQNARSLYEYDVWAEIEAELREALLAEIGLGD